MSSYGNLNSTNSLAAEPDMEACELVACAKYSLPVGWMLAATDGDRIEYKDADDYEGFFYRVPKAEALRRVRAATEVLQGNPYCWAIFKNLGALVNEIEKAPHAYLEIEFGELLAMGEPDGAFAIQAQEAPKTLTSFLDALKRKDLPGALSQINSLSELCGMKLTGSEDSDRKAWLGDMQFLGIETTAELCRWWVRGNLQSES